MKKIIMNKMVDIFDGVHNPYSIQYKALAAELENDAQIIVQYPQGMKVAKERQLTKLGYKMTEAIWTPDPVNGSNWHSIKSVWSR